MTLGLVNRPWEGRKAPALRSVGVFVPNYREGLRRNSPTSYLGAAASHVAVTLGADQAMAAALAGGAAFATVLYG